MRIPTVPSDDGSELYTIIRDQIPPGGKVLARLHMFEQAHGLRLSQPEQAEADASFQQTLSINSTTSDPQETSVETEYAYSPYLEALRQRKELGISTRSLAAIPTWRPLGPFSIPHGQTYGSGPQSRPSVAGRVSSVAIDPQDPQHILIGAASGGVWSTRDGGKRWKPVTDDQPALAIGTICFHPTMPHIVYAGTGEGDFYRRLGTGILRSEDGGEHWELWATQPFVGLGFFELLIDPNHPDRMVAATSGHLSVSEDGGKTWDIKRRRYTWDVSQHTFPIEYDANQEQSNEKGPPQDSATYELFAACTDGLYQSLDYGFTWNKIPLPNSPTGIVRMEVCHAPSDGHVVYVVMAAQNQILLWRREQREGPFELQSISESGINTSQAWYDWCAEVAPNDPNTLYIGAIDLHKGERDEDGNWNWNNISARTDGPSIHPDQHHIAIHPQHPDTLYIGNDGGLYLSPDRGTSWISLNKGLAIAEVEFMAQHPTYDVWLLAGTQDNGTLLYQGGEVWYHVADGDGGDCGINDRSPNICYHTYFNMWLRRSNAGGGWNSYRMVLRHPSGYQSLFYPPLEVNGRTVVRAGESVFISQNDGNNWEEIQLPTGAGLASALAVPSSNLIYVGTNRGHIYRLVQGERDWLKPEVLPKPERGYVSDLLIDPQNPDRIWATYSTAGKGGVFRSNDSGKSWQNVSNGLPNIGVNAIICDPMETDTLFIGCDVGIYRTKNGGNQWEDYNQGLPNAIVGDLLFHEPTRLLRAGTRNRGVWEINVDEPQTPLVYLYLRDSILDSGKFLPSPPSGDNPFNPGEPVIWYDSIDIKVDSRPLQQDPLFVREEGNNSSTIDFEFFEDDTGVFASGLTDEKGQGLSNVYVQAHNGGTEVAKDVMIYLFSADGNSIYSLPVGFWKVYTNGLMPVSSHWQHVGTAVHLPELAPGNPQIASFEWYVPSNTSGYVWLLAFITQKGEPPQTEERNVARLVRFHSWAALKRVEVLPYSAVQWRDKISAGETVSWKSEDWSISWHVEWTVIPLTTSFAHQAQIEYDVRTERVTKEKVTYWITVKNLSQRQVEIEGRYTVLGKNVSLLNPNT